MNKLHAMMVAVAVGSAGLVYGVEINLSGTVKDDSGNPLPGVEVYLSRNTALDTTGADGKYLIEGTSVIKTLLTKNNNQPLITGNTISFNVKNPSSAVTLDILNLSGQCVRHVMSKTVAAEQYTVQLPTTGLTPSTYIVSLQIGNERFTQRVLVQENGSFQSGRNSASAKNLNKRTATGASLDAVDYLNFYKNHNFTEIEKPIYSFTGTFDTIMIAKDTIPPKITILGGDTVSISFQDSTYTTGWRKYWDVARFGEQVLIEDNSGWFQASPSTSTLIDHERSSLCWLPYRAVDQENNLGVAQRLLVLFDSTVTDAIPPVLTVAPDTIKFIRGEVFDPYTGVAAVDSVDKHIELKDWIRITDNIKSYQSRNGDQIYMDSLGTYSVTYEVMDTHKNMATKKRTLVVSEPPATP